MNLTDRLFQRLFSLCGLFLTAGLLLGCDDTDPSDADTGDSDAPNTDGEIDYQSRCEPRDTSIVRADAQALFDYDHVPVFDLYLPEDTWEQLQIDARDEEYTQATACFEGKHIGNVGLRFKGAFGSLLSCFDENDVNHCRKLGMKLKFNKYDDTNRFYDLKRLNLQGNRYDDSYMKERLSYDLYRSMGIVSPRAAWAEVRVNGELMGLYGMVEQIDGRFTDNRWPDNGDGNLFKETWPVRPDEDWLVSRLKTNEETADVSDFIAFAQAMLDADIDALRETFGEYADPDYWARYMAVDDAIANFDGVTAYYTSEDAAWSGNHNFYIYEEASDRYTIIPWDLESTFAMGSFGFVPHWTQAPEDCDTPYIAWGDPDSLVIAPACDRVFQALAADLTTYREAGETLLDGPFDEATMNAVIDDHAAFIEEAVAKDPNGPGTPAFKSAVANIKFQVSKLRERLSYLLAGETWTPLEVTVDTPTDFEDQDELGLVMGPTLYNNPATGVDISLNTESPINGEQNLKIAFSFANEEAPWEQWLNYVVPIRGGTADVTELTGIRMKVRADSARNLRFELDHLYTSASNGWIREGWYIPVTEETTEVEVRFADAEVPSWAGDQGLEPLAELSDVLTAVRAIVFSPQCEGRNAAGFLPEETDDTGFIEVDDIEFF